MSKRGPKKKLDVSAMAVFALLLVRAYRVPRGPRARRGFRKAAVQAAIKAWLTWADESTTPTNYQIEGFVGAVSKELQRLEQITESTRDVRPHIHPDILDAAYPPTGEPAWTAWTGIEIAAAVAEFLPPSLR